MLSLSLLGPFQAVLDQRPLAQFHTNKAQALLIYLAVESYHVHQREGLMELLWPGLPLQSAQQSLRQTLYRLRQAVEPDDAGPTTDPILLAERFTIGLNPNAVMVLDTAEFETLSGHARTPLEWQQAADLYRGDFLSDFYVPDSENFEEWAANRRAAYHRVALDLFHRLTGHYLALNDFAAAESAVRRSLELDYFQETAHHQLLQTLAASGRRQEALSHFGDYTRRLRQEYDLEPEAETASLIAAIRQQNLPEVPNHREVTPTRFNLPEVGMAVGTTPPLPNNLPTPPTPFIGRETELATLNELMAREDGRLVTIIGPGGMGKTRLALAWAENQVHYQNSRTNGSNGHPYRHGINFLNLAPLEKPDLIIPTLANTLNFPLQKSSDRETRTPRQQILDYLCQKQMLLLFDNFEHLLDGADLIVDILGSTQNVKILVTSRERLNLREEQIYPIQGLEFPDWETPEDAVEYTAVQLFLQSARRNLPDFTLTSGSDLTFLARICRLVAGMPLAIELAAAWVEMLSLEEIAAEIQQGLDILETELRDVPPRQRSVRATIDYSWQKLTGTEKEIFAKLSVFRGGFTREAVQAIAGASLRQLARLQNKSLIQVDRSDHRYQLHELLRQYAAEKLNRDAETAEEINGRHAHYFAQLLARQEPLMFGPEEEEALNQLELERDNIEAAWQWLFNHQEIEPLLETVNALFLYYDIRIRVLDGLARGEQLINWCSDTEDPKKKLLLVRALNWHCYLNAFHLYDVSTMKTNIVRATDLLTELSQESGMVIDEDLAFNEYLSGIFVHRGVVVPQEALEHYEAALGLFQKSGNLRGMVMTLEQIVGAKFFSPDDQGGYKVALALSDQALKIARLFKSNRLMTDLVAEIGTFALQAGDFALMETLMIEVEKALIRLKETGTRFEPERLLERFAWMLSLSGRHEAALATQMEFQALRREMGLPLHAITEFQFGHMLAHIGRYAEGQIYVDRSLRMGQESNTPWIIALNLVVMGMNLMATGDVETAESALRQALALQDEINNPLDKAGNLGNLGLALARLGKYDEAKKILIEGLEIIFRTHGYLPLIETLPGIALNLAYADSPNPDLALKTHALLQTQPYYTNSRLFQDMSGTLLKDFAQTQPANEVEAALKWGREIELWEGTAELLTELRQTW